MSGKTFRPWSPHQAYLIPPSPDEWLPEGHLVHFVLEVLGELDLRAIEDELHSRDARGQKGYHPRMMVALLLYSYCSGVYSSRRIARATYEDLATRFLTGDQHPHFTRIAAFRREHLSALSELFVATVQLCARAGLVDLGHVSVDGTKIQANASKHKAMSYERMKKEEDRLQAEIKALLERAEAVDREEDERFGVGRDDFELPGELKRRETRLARIRQAKAELEAEAKQARAAQLREHAAGNDERTEKAPTAKERAAAATRAKRQRQEADKLDPPNDDDDDEPPSKLPAHRVRTQPDGTPKPKAQRNFTDPDSRIMANVPTCRATTHRPPSPKVIRSSWRARCRTRPPTRSTSCRCSRKSKPRRATNRRPSPPTLATGPPRIALGVRNRASTRSSRRGDNDATRQRKASHRRRHRNSGWLRSSAPPKATPATAAARPPSNRSSVRSRRRAAFRRFLLRGLDKVRAEWALLCATHNLLKLFRSAWAAA